MEILIIPLLYLAGIIWAVIDYRITLRKDRKILKDHIANKHKRNRAGKLMPEVA
jgi:hypothetical protein